jgi:membrane dipeptidase
VVISHANVNDVYRHLRNVNGEVIKRLVDNGGVLGLTFIPRTISDSPTLSALVKHAKYVKERYGVEVLAVGTDYLGTPPGLESVDRIETFFKALRETGFSGEEVEAVAWLNAYRVLKEALD